MSLELNNVQRFAQRIDEASGQKYTVQTVNNPYTRLNSGDGPPIFVQSGRPYAEGGDEYDLEDLPPWFTEQAALVGEKAAAACGLDKLLVEMAEPAPEPTEPEPAPKPAVKPPRGNKGEFLKRPKKTAKKE
jgi:hypothetical protein